MAYVPGGLMACKNPNLYKVHTTTAYNRWGGEVVLDKVPDIIQQMAITHKCHGYGSCPFRFPGTGIRLVCSLAVANHPDYHIAIGSGVTVLSWQHVNSPNESSTTK